MSDDRLIHELSAAMATFEEGPCRMCTALENMTPERKRAVITALSSKIGNEPLAAILRRRGVQAGRGAIKLHRQEGHTA